MEIPASDRRNKQPGIFSAQYLRTRWSEKAIADRRNIASQMDSAR